MRDIERPTPNSARAIRTYPFPPEQIVEALRRTIEELPRWTLESAGKGGLRAIRRSRLFHFKDDVTIRIESQEEGSRVEFDSVSRVGKSDLGQNRRNLKDLIAALDKSYPNIG